MCNKEFPNELALEKHLGKQPLNTFCVCLIVPIIWIVYVYENKKRRMNNSNDNNNNNNNNLSPCRDMTDI